MEESTFSKNLAFKYDYQVNSFGIDCTGNHAVLATRKGLYIVDLENQSEHVKTLPQNSKWEVTDVEWNPHSANANLIASTSNQKAIIWDVLASHTPLMHVLHVHTRAISDINWSPFNENLLATCSVDTYLHIWDIRDPKGPVNSLCAWTAGASQVKWNRHSPYVLASSHDGDVRVWDIRKPVRHTVQITAHMSKIYGIDWSHSEQNDLITCSQDKQVKFWNVTKPRVYQATLNCGVPIWRARYTPFGEGIVTLALPQYQRGQHSIFLWNFENLRTPVHMYAGHTNIVNDVQWRVRGDEFQLVTWGKDKHLRLWRVDPKHQSACGHKPLGLLSSQISTQTSIGSSSNPTTNADVTGNQSDSSVIPGTLDSATSHQRRSTFATMSNTQSRKNAVLAHSSGIASQPCGIGVSGSSVSGSTGGSAFFQQQPQNLSQEFSLVNLKIPNVQVEQMNAGHRSCTVTAKSCNHVVRLAIAFPAMYPNNAGPSFEFLPGTSVPTAVKARLNEILVETSRLHVRYNRSCLEPCLRQLVSKLERFSKETSGVDRSLSNSTLGDGNHDRTVPFPRLFGASFCNGVLVCFTSFPTSASGHHYSSSQHSNASAASSLNFGRKTPCALDGLKRYLNARTMEAQSSGQLAISNVDRKHHISHNRGSSMQDDMIGSRARGGSPQALDQLAGIKIGGTTVGTKNSRNTLPQHTAPWKSAFQSDANACDDIVDDTFAIQSYVYSSNASKSNLVSMVDVNGGLGYASEGRKRRSSVTSTLGNSNTRNSKLSSTPSRKSANDSEITAAKPTSSRNDFAAPGEDSLNESKQSSDMLFNFPSQLVRGSDFQESSMSRSNVDIAAQRRRGRSVFAPHVIIRDISPLLPVNERLGHLYTLVGVSASEVCLANATAARTVGRDDLVRAWSLAALAADSPLRSDTIARPWAFHPFGRPLLLSLMSHYRSMSDVQMLAMLACVFALQENGGSSGIALPSAVSQKYSTLDRDIPILAPEPMLTDAHRVELNGSIKAYADILYRWGLLQTHAEVLKFITISEKQHVGVAFDSLCQYCRRPLRGPRCRSCKRFGFNCSLCHLPVRGLSNFCLTCGHGGHANHMDDWFLLHDVCPAGCGCNCMQFGSVAK